jgi:(p)ppGpp synthase/HD superfamily hydrolase
MKKTTPKKTATKKPQIKKHAKRARKIPVRTGPNGPSASLFPYAIRKHGDLAWHTDRMKKLIAKHGDLEQEAILRAYEMAKERHANLKRSSGALYIIHPVRIANIIMDEWNVRSTPLIAAALLHDVVEDTQTTIKEVKDIFGADIGKLVDGVTMWKGSESPDVYLKRVSRGPEQLRIIKCADTLDNLRSWKECSPEIEEKFPRWWRQANDYVLPMARRTLKKAERQIRDIIDDKWYLEKARML